MSKRATSNDKISIQFTVKKGDIHYDILNTILEKYPSNVKATSIKEALKDLLLIFESTETENSADLIKLFYRFKNGTNNNNRK